MEQNLKLELAQEINQNLKYRNLIGALLYISSEKNLADILTKALGRVRVEKLRSLLDLLLKNIVIARDINLRRRVKI